jgi:hypothetical protein
VQQRGQKCSQRAHEGDEQRLLLLLLLLLPVPFLNRRAFVCSWRRLCPCLPLLFSFLRISLRTLFNPLFARKSRACSRFWLVAALRALRLRLQEETTSV